MDAVCRKRISHLASLLAREGLPAIALVPGASFYYLTGQNFHLMERPTLLFVTAAGDTFALIPYLEKSRWHAAMPEAETIYWQDSEGYAEALERLLARLGVDRLGVEGRRIRFLETTALMQARPSLVLSESQPILAEMRLRKDAAEIALIRQAIAISETALGKALSALHAGMTETQLRNRLMVEMLEAGADGTAFEPIVLFGAAAADCHGVPSSDRALGAGEAVLIDYGALYAGYNADITRTVFFREADGFSRDLYAAVLAANTEGRRLAGPDLTAHDLDTAVTEKLRQSGFGQYIVHKTGHGLGLDVHEDPQIMVGNRAPLVPGMLFTIEPGLYVPEKLGIRIEDNVLVEATGSTSLTAFPRQLQVV